MLEEMEDIYKGYVAYSTNLNVRKTTTSGGIFTTIAISFINVLGGVVYGAAFDKQFNVVHIRVKTENEVYRLSGSKYVQSKMDGIYMRVKHDLMDGLPVLFSGTPCQIGALRKFLSVEYDNLYCIDFICLGIPSPQIWEDYLDIYHRKYNINFVNFKDKKYGWVNWTFMIKHSRGVFREPGSVNYFMSGYLKHLYIRESCFKCPFRKFPHNSDITIADCWGIDRFAPEMNDDKGASLVITNSFKGRNLFKMIADKLKYKSVDINCLLLGNPYAIKDIKHNDSRKKFYSLYHKYGLKRAYKKVVRRRNFFKHYLLVFKWRLKNLLKK